MRYSVYDFCPSVLTPTNVKPLQNISNKKTTLIYRREIQTSIDINPGSLNSSAQVTDVYNVPSFFPGEMEEAFDDISCSICF